MNGFNLDVEGSPEHAQRILTAVQKVLAEIDREARHEVLTESGTQVVRHPWPVKVKIQLRNEPPAAGRRPPRREISV